MRCPVVTATQGVWHGGVARAALLAGGCMCSVSECDFAQVDINLSQAEATLKEFEEGGSRRRASILEKFKTDLRNSRRFRLLVGKWLPQVGNRESQRRLGYLFGNLDFTAPPTTVPLQLAQALEGFLTLHARAAGYSSIQEFLRHSSHADISLLSVCYLTHLHAPRVLEASVFMDAAALAHSSIAP